MNIYELIGVIIGDGNIIYNKNNKQYRLEITGNATEDKEYFINLSKIINKISNKKPTIRERSHKKGKSLDLHINNKIFIEFLIKKIGLPCGRKTFTIKIPEKLINWKYSKHIIRGIFESDGCIFFSKSKVFKYPTYPRLEIRTSSNKLKDQLMEILKERGFKIRLIDKCKTCKIYLSGPRMLNKWVKEIGISNIKNKTKINLWKKLGYYIPKTNLKQRKRILASNYS